ncbi:MAG: LysR family transcriptional regulator [Hyphomicrobiales bacterium]
MRLTLRHFEIVQTLNSEGSVTTAAKALGLTQPGLSRALKMLEDQIGGKLFTKGDHGLIATPLAEVFLRRHKSLATPIEAILNDIEQLKSAQMGRVVVGAGTYAAFVSVYQAIAKTHQKHPALILDLIERDWRDILAELISGALDLAIIDVSAARQTSEAEIEPLPVHPCGIAVRKDHPLTKKDRLTSADLMDYTYCGTYPSQWVLEKARFSGNFFGSAGTNFSHSGVGLGAHTLSAVRQIIQNSDAFGILPKILFHRNKTRALADGIVLLDIPELNWLRTNYGLVWRRNRPLSPAVNVLMTEIRKAEDDVLKEEARLSLSPPG